MKKVIFLFVFLISYTSYGQTLTVFDVDDSNFPNLKAKVFAFDENGNQISDLSQYHVSLIEDEIERIGVKLKCPPIKPLVPLSSILTIDISGSMSESTMDIAKSAVTAWIKLLPLSKSECAITAFRSDNYFISDFTQDRAKLISSIENLKSFNGTDFNAAFTSQSAGALIVADKGKFKRVIVLLSDGFADGDKDNIINNAIANKTVIYCVTVNNPTPELLKDIATKTGGRYFDNISTPMQAENVYRSILMIAQGGEPSEMVWTSGGCKPDREAKLKLTQPSEDLATDFSFSVSFDKLPQIKYSPSVSVKFGKKESGKIFTEKISITAQIDPLKVKAINSSNSKMRIVDYGGGAPPFTLKSGEERNLTVEFKPDDSSYTYSKFEIESDACYGRYFYASGGDLKKKAVNQTIKLLFPNGDEELIAGSDTTITWEGVSPADNVKLEYTIDDGKQWKQITDTASGLSYKWHVPFNSSDQVFVRVTAKERYDSFNEEGMVLIPAGTFQMGNTGAYDGDTDEKPVHEVTITKPFLLGKYEVTQKLYQSVMGNNPSFFKGENLPVEKVSWYDAVEFCNKLSEQEGLEPCYSGNGTKINCNFNANGYRLPTEAEWEYACKAGSITDFCNGKLKNNGCSPIDANLNLIGWYCANSENTTHDVGQKKPNVFGVYDMNGNVWEWCWDWYVNYTNKKVNDPKNSDFAWVRVLRGGSWFSLSKICRSSIRDGFNPDEQNYCTGLRLARTI